MSDYMFSEDNKTILKTSKDFQEREKILLYYYKEKFRNPPYLCFYGNGLYYHYLDEDGKLCQEKCYPLVISSSYRIQQTIINSNVFSHAVIKDDRHESCVYFTLDQSIDEIHVLFPQEKILKLTKPIVSDFAKHLKISEIIAAENCEIKTHNDSSSKKIVPGEKIMPEKTSNIRMTFKSPSGHLMCLPLDKYEEYMKSQPGYVPPKPKTTREKIEDLVGDKSNIGFVENGLLQAIFKIDQETEHLICLEFEKEGLVKKDKNGQKEEFWCYIHKDIDKMLEIIEKYINK